MLDATHRSTVADVLHRSARRVPGRPALVFAERTWTYADLDDAVSRVAVHLLDLGLAKGDRVAAFGKNSDAYVIGFLACCRAGLVHVPMNNQFTAREAGHVLRQSEARVTLVDPSMRAIVEEAEGCPATILPLRDAEGSLLDVARSGEVPEVAVEVTDSDLAQLLYTSGTTSAPKGAMMSHRALVHEYVSAVVALDVTEDDAPLHVMPLYHSAQMHVFLLPWLAVGATNTLLETPDPTEILRRLEAGSHGAFFAAPTLWVALANHPDLETRDLSALRKAYYGAAIMPGPVLTRLQETLPDLGFYNCFGQSEIAPLATVLRPEEHAARPSSTGRPVLFVELRVVDIQGRDVAPGERGEVVYRSPQLCDGYWGRPEETDAAFRDGWFHSGDLAVQDEEGYLTIVDRVRDVINTGGVLVAPREVEDVLYAHPAVAEVAVVGIPDDKWGEAVYAFVVPRPGSDVDEDTLREHARANLATFKIPKQIRLLDALPRNASGKILKRELREG
ncbi:fatty acyl-CoA synthetase [Mobilicoccus pelagius]|uniref:Putative fatty-acid--CoA ligase n=1 Tax=Mobilicoccus pelagius NBRC 104925 TaxID=1089455 RepID=H5UMM7_9MICO|nr:fatty acyl-CoA synthetase [Mobilicoccus pelagius]GAB46985.1 putative fatty-acid--CoA ligase [Mobilicoccus pelagius NBRC 104925]